MNNKDKKTDSTKTAMLVLFALGVMLIDVSFILTIICIAVAVCLPFIKKARETGEKVDLKDIGGTAKKVIAEAKEYYKNEFDTPDDDDDKDDDDEDEDADTLTDVLFGKDDEPEPEPCYTGTEFDTPDEGSFLKRMTAQKKAEEVSDCEPDHVHVEPDYNMPPDEKRREQLNNMLKNGIIDKKEYKILLKKYGLSK